MIDFNQLVSDRLVFAMLSFNIHDSLLIPIVIPVYNFFIIQIAAVLLLATSIRKVDRAT